MTALALLLAVPLVMWVGQSVLLALHGRPLRWRIDSGDAPRAVRTGGRIVTQLSLVGFLLAFPAIQGEAIIDYYAAMLPWDKSPTQLVHGAAASILFLCALFGAWLATDRLTVEVHHSRRRWMRRLALLPATALFGAFVEELMFRGVILRDLLGDLPTVWAVAIGAGVFAIAHYVRAVKRRWTLGGHVLLGVVLCLAFVETGNKLWLPVGLHAGGIFMIMGVRPFVRYQGPAWLTGASIFPFAGGVGILGLGMLAHYVVTYYGAS